MRSAQEMTLEQALEWFDLDQSTVNYEKLKVAYRKLALAHHPDRKGNYREKIAGTENFRAATAARDIIAMALEKKLLPRSHQGSPQGDTSLSATARPHPSSNPSARTQQSSSRPRTQSSVKPESSFIFSDRDRYDFHKKRPMELAIDLPIVGPVISFVMVIGMICAMAAGVIAIFPLLIIAGFVSGFSMDKIKSGFEKHGQRLTGLPLFALYYLFTGVGAYVWSSGNEQKFLYAIGLIWFVLTLLAFDEVYSFVRYYLMMRKSVRDLRSIAIKQD